MKKKLLTPVIILALTVFLNACGGQADTLVSGDDSADALISEGNSVNDAVVSNLAGTSVEGFQYEYDADTQGIKITGYTGTSDEVQIPDRIEDEPVTCIGKDAFNESDVTEVVIPDTVTVIGERAFCNCTQLANIVIPDGVAVIGDNAFVWCKRLANIVIPDSITEISFAAFVGTGITHIEIPGSVVRIGDSAFSNCTGLTEVIIHSGTEVIGDYAFNGCNNLANVDIADSVTEIGDRAFNGCTNLRDVVIPSSVTEISSDAFVGCTNLSDETKQRIQEINPDAYFEYAIPYTP